MMVLQKVTNPGASCYVGSGPLNVLGCGLMIDFSASLRCLATIELPNRVGLSFPGRQKIKPNQPNGKLTQFVNTEDYNSNGENF